LTLQLFLLGTHRFVSAPTTEAPAEPSTEPAATSGASKEDSVGLTSGCSKSILTVPQKESSKEKKAEKRDPRQSAAKVGRRLSSRVGEFFKPKKVEASAPAKVDQYPPTIEEPVRVAPLENPATTTSVEPSSEAVATTGETKAAEAPPAVAVVAAAA
jgi:hypothetical protein